MLSTLQVSDTREYGTYNIVIVGKIVRAGRGVLGLPAVIALARVDILCASKAQAHPGNIGRNFPSGDMFVIWSPRQSIVYHL